MQILECEHGDAVAVHGLECACTPEDTPLGFQYEIHQFSLVALAGRDNAACDVHLTHEECSFNKTL